MKRWNITCLWLLSILLMGVACGGSVRVSHHAEVGSTHVAFVSVAPWGDAAGDLQPVFKLSADDALKEVAPFTQRADKRRMRATSIGVRAALPTTTGSATRTETFSSGSAEPEISETRTVTSATGDVSTVERPAPAGGERSAEALAPLARQTAVELARVDPMLKYRTAAALYQEVRMLSRYIRDVARRRRYVPYVTRVQLTVMPRRRGLPYDAYTTLSFMPCGVQYDDNATCDRVPYVTPLLITDNLELSDQSRTHSKLLQWAVGLAATYQGIGLAGDAASSIERLTKVTGRDINSLFTVGRVNDNTVRVRVGATHRASSEDEHALEPQNHYVTLLVLVPKEIAESDLDLVRMLRLQARTEFVDVDDGRSLPWKRDKAMPALRERIARYGVALEDNTIENLIGAVRKSEKVTFRNFLKGTCTNPAPEHCRATRYWAALWVDMSNYALDSAYASASLELPAVAKPQIFDQAALLTDDGKSKSIVTLRGRALHRTELVSVHLKHTRVVKGNTKDTVVAATDITVNERGNTLTLTFPSLAAFGLGIHPQTTRKAEKTVRTRTTQKGEKVEKTGKFGQVNTTEKTEKIVTTEQGETIENTDRGEGSSAKIFVTRRVFEYKPGPPRTTTEKTEDDDFTVVYRLDKNPTKAKPGFKISVGSTSLVATKSGDGEVIVHVTIEKNGAKQVLLDIDAQVAGVDSIQGPVPTLVKGTYVITKTSSFKLKLKNLVPNRTVTLKARNEKKINHTPLVLTVHRSVGK